jgi:hypothetical protein
MTVVKNFPSNYHTISWSQLYYLKSISSQILTGPLTDVATQEKVQDWQAVAQKLDQSIRAASPFYRYVLDIVTLHLVKKWVLRSMLPAVMNQIILKVNEIADEKFSQSTGVFREGVSCFRTLKKAQQYFNDNKATLVPYANDMTIKQIESYFKQKIDLIVHHKTIPAIPRWYHATRAGNVASDILSGGQLLQHQAIAGYGVYFSTQHEVNYGDYCFAFDQNMIHPLRNVSYFVPASRHSIWIRSEHNVDVKWNAVAHIVVTSDAEEQILREHLAKKELDHDAAIAATCPIISQSANKAIHKCFQETFGQTSFPDHWKRHSWFPLLGSNRLLANLPYCENSFRRKFL